MKSNNFNRVPPYACSVLEPFSKPAGPASKPKFRSPPPQNAAVPVELDDQRQRTLGFVNEGLEVGRYFLYLSKIIN